MGGEPSSSNGARECRAVTEGYLGAKLALWQGRLKLGDWKIQLAISQAKGETRQAPGNIRWDRYQKSAAIRIEDAADDPSSCASRLGALEFTMVHELVRLELASLPRSESGSEEERAVDRITEALVALQRRPQASTDSKSSDPPSSSY
jgi:hypothetical protein